MNIKKGDKITVITGKDKGKSGTVSKAMPREDKVIVGGLNVIKVHKRARKAGEKGQTIEKSMPIHVSNVKKA